ncbi:hypothetical protein [uncultured Erythrobacter sp.]|uniref:hypothetical protein n=1 Tax=uncultured Erythrobacter sp. TaxID=263913 RepID=UPI002624B598|nr:hypothetical protein [uncultured Erythrobacter sp.]
MNYSMNVGFCSGLAAVGISMFALGSAQATTFFEEKFECPIGGEKFKAQVVASNSTWGQRADGKPYGALAIWPIPECPDNGLILFEDKFEEDELALLAKAIATPEYQSMREIDTPRFRLFWLKRAIGRPVGEQLGALLQATWQTDEDWPRKIRYQAEFVKQTTGWKRPTGTNSDDLETWFWMNMRAVNALRELGYYPEGLKHLRFVMKEAHLPKEPDAKENAEFFGSQLETLLLEENPNPEPTNLTPVHIGRFRCVTGKELTPVELETCATEQFAAAIQEFEFKPKGAKKLTGRSAIQAAHDEYRHQK